MIAFLDAGHAAADIDHDAGTFMAEDRREQAFGIGAGQREFVGVADAGGLDFDQHLAFARSLELDGRDFKRFAGGESYGGANVHGRFLVLYGLCFRPVSSCETGQGSLRVSRLPDSICSGNQGRK